MSQISTLVEQGKFEEAIALDEASLRGKDLFFRVSAYLSLGKGEEAMRFLLAHRDALFAEDPVLTLKANFEVRFLLKQFDEAEEDLTYFSSLPYVSQKVEEALRSLPSTIAATRYSSSNKGHDLEELLQMLSSPSDDLMLLSALNGLKKVGELEDYRGLVEELLVGPYHDDVKTYALMLLSAKGSTHPTKLIKRGKTYEVVPSRLGTPYGLPEYSYLRKKIDGIGDSSLRDVMGELLDLHALISYPERFLVPGEEEAYYRGLTALGHAYLGQKEGELDDAAKRYRDLIETLIKENPPLLG